MPRAAAAAALALAVLDAAQRRSSGPISCSSVAVAGDRLLRFHTGTLNEQWPTPRELEGPPAPRALELDLLQQGHGRASTQVLPVLPIKKRKGQSGALSEYEFGPCLGEGACGQVFRARHKATGELCAVKRCRSIEGSTAQDFESEVRALSRLQHPGVVGLIEYFSDGEFDYLVEELCDGVCLLDFIGESGVEWDGVAYLPEVESVEIIRQCLAAVADCHAHGFAHRDLKPENVVVAQDGSVKIVDFGLAGPASPKSGKHRGSLLGSFPYMAPEMVTEDSHSVAVDVWSLGVVFFTLMTGEFLVPDESSRAKRCLTDETFVERRLAHCKAFSGIDISPQAKDLLLMMLQYDALDRITAQDALSHPLFACSVE